MAEHRDDTVLFDHRIFTTQVHGGISHYIASLARELPSHGFAPTVAAPVYLSPTLDTLPRGVVRGVRLSGGRLRDAIGRRLGRRLGPIAMYGRRADVHHETYYGRDRLAPASVPVVVTVHDMIHEAMPEYFRAEGDAHVLVKRASIERADALICISESTRRDLLRFYPGVEKRTVVIHHGVYRPRADVAPQQLVGFEQPPYLLHVGGRRGWKNFDALIGAYASSPSLRRTFELLLVGGGTSTAAEQRLIADSGVASRVRFASATDSELPGIYSGAAALVYPSRYEGFGLPTLEAMAAGCPVICLRSSSLPEVCGTAARFAEAEGAEALREAIEAVVTSPAETARLRAAGLERVRQFTWEACARRTADVYRAIL